MLDVASTSRSRSSLRRSAMLIANAMKMLNTYTVPQHSLMALITEK